MLWRPASSLPRLLFFWRRVGHGRAGVPGRVYACGVGSSGGGVFGTGGAGSGSVVGPSSLQVSMGYPLAHKYICGGVLVVKGVRVVLPLYARVVTE
jgi:hypothetical protein